jgi:hypothetical protein
MRKINGICKYNTILNACLEFWKNVPFDHMFKCSVSSLSTNYTLVKLKIEIKQPSVATVFDKVKGGNFILITTNSFCSKSCNIFQFFRVYVCSVYSPSHHHTILPFRFSLYLCLSYCLYIRGCKSTWWFSL